MGGELTFRHAKPDQMGVATVLNFGQIARLTPKIVFWNSLL